jgi:hypothetical protein
MPTRSRTSLSRIFVGGLAIASNACASTAPSTQDAKPVVVETPSATPVAPTTATAISSAAPKFGLSAYAASFKPVDFAKAMPPGVELLGFIDVDGNGTTCSAGPCPKEWKDLLVSPGAHSAVVKRGGKLEVITVSEFAAKIGAVDSPERAALRARMDDYRRPGRCSDFSAAGFACGAAGDGVPVRKTDGGFEVVTFGSRDVCAGSQYGDAMAIGIISISQTGQLEVVENDLTKSIDDELVLTVTCRYPTRGRMFEGFVDCADEESEHAYFLRAARQESAAVTAFERLAHELSAHGAPPALIAEASRAAADERRHARMFRREADRIAVAIGVDRAAPEPAPTLPLRPLFAVLEENATEGCVNETYAAVVATHQALAAKSARLRRSFAAIAGDEQRHAALAFRIHAWGLARVDEGARQALARTLADARREMLATPGPSGIGRAMGEPPRELAAAAFTEVTAMLEAA